MTFFDIMTLDFLIFSMLLSDIYLYIINTADQLLAIDYPFICLQGCGSLVQLYRAGTGNLETSLIALPCTTVHGFQLGNKS